MRHSILTLLMFGMIAGLSSPLLAQETKIPQKSVPAAVMSAFRSSYPNAKIRGTNKEINHGVANFEIESTDGKTRRDLLYSANGTVNEIEEIIPAKQLPDAVRDGLHKSFPKSTIKSIEKNIQGTVTHYEIALITKGKRSEAIFNPDGSIFQP